MGASDDSGRPLGTMFRASKPASIIRSILRRPVLTLPDYHEVGKLAEGLGEDPRIRAHGPGWKKQLAAFAGTSVSTLNKCCQFFRAYAKEDLDALAKHAGWALVSVSLAVGDKGQRLALLQRAGEEGWSAPDLQRHLQGQFGKRKKGGRPKLFEKSRGPVADISRLSDMLSQVNSFLTGVWEPALGANLDRFGRLPASDRATASQKAAEALELIGTIRQKAPELEKALSRFQ